MINDLSKAFDQNGLIAELMKEKDQLRKENLDLNRQVSVQCCLFQCIPSLAYVLFPFQVKELEKIVRRRAHPNFSNVSDIIKNNDSKGYEKESEAIKNLKKELLEKQHVIIELKNQLVESKVYFFLICFQSIFSFFLILSFLFNLITRLFTEIFEIS